MALTYRGRKFTATAAVPQPVEAMGQGTYRGVSVALQRAAASIQYGTATKQYRGVAY